MSNPVRKRIGIRRRRRAAVIVCVLVVLLLVTLLSVQTLQTLSVIRRGDNDRVKIMQAREVLELGRYVNWSEVESQELSVAIPDSIDEESDIASNNARSAVLERLTNENDSNATTRLVARFPAGEAGEVTTTLDENHE